MSLGGAGGALGRAWMDSCQLQLVAGAGLQKFKHNVQKSPRIHLERGPHHPNNVMQHREVIFNK